MRKYRLFFSLLMFCFLLCSCGKQESKTVTDNSLLPNLICKESRYFGNNQIIVPLKEGYYALSTHYNYLTYINNFGAQTILCNKPECQHFSSNRNDFPVESCNATVSALPYSISAYGEYVYVLEYNDHEVSLVRISNDGSEHKRIMAVGNAPDEGSYFSYLFTNPDTVYLIYNEPDYRGEERTVNLNKIDLAKKEITSVYQYTCKGAYLSYMKSWNNKLYFMKVQEEKNAGSNLQGRLMEYDLVSGETREVLDDNVFSYTVTDTGDIYYYIAGDGLYLLSAGEMKGKKIRESTEETTFVRLAYDGCYLYMENFENQFYIGDAPKQHFIYVCDQNGKLLNSIKGGPLMADMVSENMILALGRTELGLKWNYIDKESILDANTKWRLIETE